MGIFVVDVETDDCVGVWSNLRLRLDGGCTVCILALSFSSLTDVRLFVTDAKDCKVAGSNL